MTNSASIEQLTRYTERSDHVLGTLWMEATFDGEYVKFSDVAALIAQARAAQPEQTDEPKVSEYSEAAKAKIGARMPCGACVTNVYEAYEAGRCAAQAHHAAATTDDARDALHQLRYAVSFRAACVIEGDPAKIAFANDKVWAAHEKAGEVLAAMSAPNAIQKEGE